MHNLATTLLTTLLTLAFTTPTTTASIILPRQTAPSVPVCDTDTSRMMPLADAQTLNTMLDQNPLQCCFPNAANGGSSANGGWASCAQTNDNGATREVWITAEAPGLDGKCIDDARLANYVAGLIGACKSGDGKSVGGWQAVVEVEGMNVRI